MVAGARECAADDQDAGVERVHQSGEAVTEIAAGLAHGTDGARIAGADVLDDLAGIGGREPFAGQLNGERVTSDDCLQTAHVPAGAYGVVAAGDVDVSDIAGEA